MSSLHIITTQNALLILAGINERPKWPQSCTIAPFFWNGTHADNNWPEKFELGGECWALGSCQVSLNSIQRLHRRRRKYLSQSEAGTAILLFWSAWRTQTWKRTLIFCFLLSFVVFCFLSGFIEFNSAVEEKKSKNVSANQRPRRPSCISDRPENYKLGRGTFRYCFLSSSIEFRSVVAEKKSKIFRSIRCQDGHLVFPIVPKITNLAEDVQILFPVKFRWISV